MSRRAHLLCFLPFALLAGCTAFDNQWNATRPPVAANPSAPLAGKWEGSWQSDATAYQGLMRAIVVPKPTSEAAGAVTQHYDVQLKFMLFDALSNEYGVTLDAIQGKDGKLHFEGQKDLGTWAGGYYKFDGYVDDDVFFCDFTSGKDCGTYTLRRLLIDTH